MDNAAEAIELGNDDWRLFFPCLFRRSIQSWGFSPVSHFNFGIIVAVGGDVSAVAAMQATKTTPIVFGMGGDPVKAGLVESLGRPGRNATGFTLLTNELEPKRLGLLHDLQPDVRVIGIFLNPNFPPAAGQLAALEKAAQVTSQRLNIVRASNDTELSAGFTSIVQQSVGALLVAADPTSIHGAAGSLRLRHKIDCPPFTSFASMPLTAV